MVHGVGCVVGVASVVFAFVGIAEKEESVGESQSWVAAADEACIFDGDFEVIEGSSVEFEAGAKGGIGAGRTVHDDGDVVGQGHAQ